MKIAIDDATKMVLEPQSCVYLYARYHDVLSAGYTSTGCTNSSGGDPGGTGMSTTGVFTNISGHWDM